MSVPKVYFGTLPDRPALLRTENGSLRRGGAALCGVTNPLYERLANCNTRVGATFASSLLPTLRARAMIIIFNAN